MSAAGDTTAMNDMGDTAAMNDYGDEQPFDDFGLSDFGNLTDDDGAWKLFKRGIAVSPEIRTGLGATLLMGIAVAAGRISIPIVIQRTIDHGLTTNADGSTTVDFGKIVLLASLASVAIVVSAVIATLAKRRLVRATEATIYGLRTRAFAHVHRLSLADHVDNSSGLFLARVTSDVEAIARFCQWGLMTWTVGPMVILGLFAVMAVYSWQLALLVLCTFLPAIPLLKWLQRRQLNAYDELRTSVSGLLGKANEAITGAATVRAYGVGERAKNRIHQATEHRYRAGIQRNRFMAMAFSVGDFFGALSLAGAFAVGIWQREAWGLSSGTIVAVLFLVTLLNEPVGELGETTDSTQEAIAGWRKILQLLDMPIDVVEPEDGAVLEHGALSITAKDLNFAYHGGSKVLHDVSVHIPAGTSVAVVGETGSGKTTFAKLLCRLADPTTGTLELGGVELSRVTPESRLASVRMVPQDGFLFDTTLRENIRFGRPSATDDEIADAVARLELDAWVDQLPLGLETPVGSRGGNLSVGERQLVALIRAALADPGLLILDEATSSVDPETDRALAQTIARMSEGRTVVSIAHRLATAEAADLILVFDHGRLVEAGNHAELVGAGGIYSGLHQAWVGNTQRVPS